MSRKYKIRDQEKLYFVTFTVIQWLDVFTRNEYKNIFIESLRYCQKQKKLEVWAYVIMTSHVHLIVGRNGEPALQDIVRDIKKFTSFKIVEAIKNNPQESRRELFMWLFEKAGKENVNNKRYQFWQQNNQPIELNTNDKFDRYLNYIHMNPVVAGIVLAPEDFLYSSALNYSSRPEAVLDILLM
jgi:putative transposase